LQDAYPCTEWTCIKRLNLLEAFIQSSFRNAATPPFAFS
jgi:hypothetical protein